MTNHAQPFDSELAPVWQHIDQIFPEDGDNLLTMDADSVESARDAQRSGMEVHSDVLARMLEASSRQIHTASANPENAVMTQGPQETS